jgi:DNA polymerase I-like protein with 3'-5' exonuclease and polymerase domains
MSDENDSLFPGEALPDWHTYWKGMPAYAQEDLSAWQTVMVHFPTKQDRDAFAKLVDQPIGIKTKFVWYPKPTIQGMDASLRWKTPGPVDPRYPVYVPTKGRWETPQTIRALSTIQVRHYVVVQPQEVVHYKPVLTPYSTLLVLPETVKGLVPTRNWIRQHSEAMGAKRHWQIDDNIKAFGRFHNNQKIDVTSGVIFRVIEDFTDRYENVAVSGPHYYMFAPTRKGNDYHPITINTRVYSCSLINNEMPHWWRDVYNDDTDVCLRALKDGWCVLLFNAFLCLKTTTMVLKGGNTEIYLGAEEARNEWLRHTTVCEKCKDPQVTAQCEAGREILSKDGRWRMADSLVRQHPDVTTIEWKWDRWQHFVDYRPFRKNPLRLKPGIVIPEGTNDYGMELIRINALPQPDDEIIEAEEPLDEQVDEPVPPIVREETVTLEQAAQAAPTAPTFSVLDFIGAELERRSKPVEPEASKPTGQQPSAPTAPAKPAPQAPVSSMPEPAPAPTVEPAPPEPAVGQSVVEFLTRHLEAPSTYKQDEFPNLSGVNDVIVNVETTGLRWWESDVLISATIGSIDGKHQWFLPCGFAEGNLPREKVIEFLKRELPDKNITNANTKFDVQMLRKDGVDLEKMGCTVSDVQHYAALLDDNRKKFNLDLLAEEFLGGVRVPRLDESRMTSYSAAQVAARARYQVEVVAKLREVFWPKLDAEDLQKVRKLEDEVIFVVCEMERNGAPLDMERLERWTKESQTIYESTLHELAKMLGRSINPNAPTDMVKVFEHLKLPVTYLESGSPSFTDAILKRIEHPTIQKIRFALKLADLRSRYLLKYQKCVGSDGILRYALHQTRYQKDSGEEGGTGPGRFSSSELEPGVGANIQQVMKLGKQRKMFGFNEKDASHDEEIFMIRMLMVPQQTVSDFEVKWLCADAEQIEYRIFGDYANNPRVVEAYKENPRLNFHTLIEGYMKPQVPDLDYDGAKTLNFANIYGAAQVKKAVMLGFITESEGEDIKKRKAWNDPKLAPVKSIIAIYDREIPEVKPLLKKAQDLAASRGFVKTKMGRRSRFNIDKRYHKALNNVIQGGAADYNKVKLVEVHKAREYTGLLLRYTVHDELDGDARQPETLERVREVLDSQSWPEMKIPLLWDVKTGRNWAEAK